MRSTDETSLHGVVGEDVRKNEQYKVDGYFLPKLAEEGLTGDIFMKQMLNYSENCVEDYGDAYPLGELPILEEVLGDICHNGEWQGNN